MVAKTEKAHGRRYPWEELFKQKSFTLQRGKDYLGASHGMASTVRQAAKRFGVHVAVKIYDKYILVGVGEEFNFRNGTVTI